MSFKVWHLLVAVPVFALTFLALMHPSKLVEMLARDVYGFLLLVAVALSFSSRLPVSKRF